MGEGIASGGRLKDLHTNFSSGWNNSGNVFYSE